MAQRDDKGRFVKGNKASPGRPSKEREIRFYEITRSAVSDDDWTNIVQTAVRMARNGDAQARKWLSDYLIGTPAQKMELTGSEGGDVVLRVIYDKKDPTP